MHISLREAQECDMDAVYSLYPHLLSEDDPSPGREKLLESWNRLISNPAMTCFIAEVDKKIVGTCCLIIVPNLTRGARPYALIETVVVHTEFQGRGIGRKMIEHAIEKARNARCYKIMLLSGVENKNHGFYERLGFDRNIKVGFELRMR